MKKKIKLIISIMSFFLIPACSNVDDSSLIINSLDSLVYEEGASAPFEGISNISLELYSSERLTNVIQYEVEYKKGKMVSISPLPNDSDLKIENNLIFFANQKIPFTGSSRITDNNKVSLYEASYVDGKLIFNKHNRDFSSKNKSSSLGLDKIDNNNLSNSDKELLKTSYVRNYNPDADSLRCEITYANQHQIWLHRLQSVKVGDFFLEHRSNTRDMKTNKIRSWQKWMGGNEFVNMRTTIWEAECKEREGIFSGVTEEGGIINGKKHGNWIYYNNVSGELSNKEDWFHGKLIKSEKLGKSSNESMEERKKLAEKRKKQAEAKRKEQERLKKQAEAERKEQERQKKLRANFDSRVLNKAVEGTMQFLQSPTVEQEALLISYFEELLPLLNNKSISYNKKSTILNNAQEFKYNSQSSEVFERLLGRESIGMFEFDYDDFKHMFSDDSFKDFAKYYMMYTYNKLNSYDSRYYNSSPEKILKDYIKLYNNADNKRRNPAAYTKLSIYLQKISIEIYGDTEIKSDSYKYKKNIETEFFKNVKKNQK
tara:strand:- start:5579 stop:7204 length:1626 start_codon:yes stop_codon:yes gene_type:complete